MGDRLLLHSLPPVPNLRSLVRLVINRHDRRTTANHSPVFERCQTGSDLRPVLWGANKIDEAYINDGMDQLVGTPRKSSILVCGEAVVHATKMCRPLGHEIGKVLAAQYSSHIRQDWLEADVLQLPFDDCQFDAATMGYGLRNVTDISACLKELHRVLKTGAKGAILDFHRPENTMMRAFQQWYLDNLVVPTASQMGLKEEYAYINPSLERFPSGREQVKKAREVGFANALHYPIANGMMGVLVVTKDES